MTKDYEDGLIKIKDKIAEARKSGNNLEKEMWITYFVGYIEALEMERKGK